MSNIYDNHTVCIKTKYDKDKLVELLDNKLTLNNLDKSYIINFVIDKNGTYKNMAFVYFYSTDTYNYLTKSNNLKNILFNIDWTDETLCDDNIILNQDLIITKAYIKDINKNILTILNIPNDVDMDEIKNFFLPYIVDHNDMYPYVEIKDNKAFVYFDPTKNHAQFIMLMVNKIIINNTIIRKLNFSDIKYPDISSLKASFLWNTFIQNKN